MNVSRIVSFVWRRLEFYNALRTRCFLHSSLSGKMKKMIDARQYKDVLDLLERQSQPVDDTVFNIALKACTKLNAFHHGIKLHQQLSEKSLANPFIQSSLIHFYSKYNLDVTAVI